jgi:hypothetical protein
MRRLIPTILAASLALGAGFVPGSGAADEACESDTFVFSWVDAIGGASAQPYGSVCSLGGPAIAAAGTNPVDHRVIWPGASAISIRYPNDNIKGRPGSISGILKGLGFAKKRITLNREACLTGPEMCYDSPVISLPHAEGSQGCLAITLVHTKIIKKRLASGKVKRIRKVVFKDTTTWRTADSIC